ncbi:MAG: hypothetical protein J6333_08040, partial [Planctomycetes bacterium]|nr:hypothetical protein [Planctomycetota bacterium]
MERERGAKATARGGAAPAPGPRERVFAGQADQAAAVLPRGRVNVKTRLAIDMTPGVSLSVEP